MNSSDFIKCVEFHGHSCPGLAIGFRAAKAALNYFAEKHSEDEELAAIVENDACGVDAVQVLTGCTFGKGNLIHKDYGKQVFYFINRKTGKTIRIALKADLPKSSSSPEHAELIRKAREDIATVEEITQLKELHRKKACHILEAPIDSLFNMREVEMRLPEKAIVVQSLPCEKCGEPTMSTKLDNVAGKKICRECLSNQAILE